ncbi:MAG: branched-chain amino acid ABC transporter permease [Rhizobiales bacterium]|nr:branched-chain amino acid ABC transporter permease [Hyphomicrobiales bacterium]
MLSDPQFFAEQFLNSLQFSMLLFLLAIGLSVVFGLMDYLNLSHGTIYMFAAYVAFSIAQLGGSFWVALAVAPVVAAAVGVSLYFLLLKRAETGGHLTQVLLTVGVIYMGTDLIRIVYGDLPKGVPQPESLSSAVNLFGILYPAYRLFIIAIGLLVMIVLYFALERTRLGALVRAGVDDRATAETLGIDIGKVFALVFGIGTYLAGVAGVVAAPVFGVYPGMDVSIIILVLIVVVVGGLGSLKGVIVGSLLIGFADTFGKILLPQFAMMMIYLVMALVLIFRPSGLMPARRFSASG